MKTQLTLNQSGKLSSREMAGIYAGASGCLLKSADEGVIADSVHKALGGGAPINSRAARVRMVLNRFASRTVAPQPDHGLTAREQEVLKLAAQGLLVKEIAGRLGLSFHTVDNHLRGVYAKLQVHTRGGAVAKAVSERLLSPVK
jgi:DNA-binding NarL/FixJ family response regulator